MSTVSNGPPLRLGGQGRTEPETQKSRLHEPGSPFVARMLHRLPRYVRNFLTVREGRVEELDFDRMVQDALDSLPQDLREAMSNVELVVEEEPPPGQRLLG